MKKNIQNCLEYWDCKIKLECPAYQTESGKDCYEIASYICSMINQGMPVILKVERSFKFCWECP